MATQQQSGDTPLHAMIQRCWEDERELMKQLRVLHADPGGAAGRHASSSGPSGERDQESHQRELFGMLLRILEQKAPRIGQEDGNKRHALRRQALIMLGADVSRPAPSDSASLATLVQSLITVLHDDNEENATLALQLLGQPVRSARGDGAPQGLLVSHQPAAAPSQPHQAKSRLVDFCIGVVDATKGMRELVRQEESTRTSQMASTEPEGIGRGAKASPRLLPAVAQLTAAWAAAGDLVLVRELAPRAWNALKDFPADILAKVRNRRLYREYLNGAVTELLGLLDLAWAQRPAAVEVTLAQTAEVQLQILLNLPPGTERLRLAILQRLEHGLKEECYAADARRGGRAAGGPSDGNQAADGSRQQPSAGHPGGANAGQPQGAAPDSLVEVLGQRCREHVIDSARMQGRGRPCAGVQVSHAGIFRGLGQCRVGFTSLQIQRVMKIICRSLLDNAVTLSQKNTLIYYLHELNAEYGRQRGEVPQTAQFEILTCLVDLCKILRTQLVATLALIKQHEEEEAPRAGSGQPHLEEDQPVTNQASKQKREPKEELFELGEKALLEAAKPFPPNSQTSDLRESWNSKTSRSQNQARPGEVTEAHREVFGKVMWNLVASAELVFGIAREQRQQSEGRGSGTFLDPSELKVLKRLLVHGSEVIQGLAELRLQSEERPTVRFFAEFVRRVRPLQLRDILADIGPRLFSRVVEAKTRQCLQHSQRSGTTAGGGGAGGQSHHEQGVVSLVQGHFARFAGTPPQVINRLEDEYVSTFLEALFDFVSTRLASLSAPPSPGPGLGPASGLDKELQALPRAELQETLVDLALFVGEQALRRPNDIRMKHVFFSVFVFCVKQAREGALVPDHYYVIIIRLFRDLCTPEHEGLVKEFLPMIQGLLETFLQSRDSAPYIEVTNHIFECVPAKLKSLLDYLPVISKPVVESMRTVAHRDLERPLNTLQLWVSGLGQFPEILDPAISHVLPELTGMLYKILYQLPNFPFKLLGKLGARSRPYWQDQEVSSRRYPEGGLKISLKDRHSGREVVLGIDAAIEVVLVKIFENPSAYSLSRLLDAFKLVKTALLCYVDTDIDVDYLIARIVGAQDRGLSEVEDEIAEAATAFDSSRRHNHGSFMARGSEAHAFEKILRSLLFACSLPKDNPDTLKVRQKVLKFMQWVTKYFTLLYVCKNGRLSQSREDEVSPLKFLETISAFLLYNLRQGSGGPQQSSYFEGTVVCLETMLKLLNQLFGDRPELFSSLEIVGILIKKVCHLAYEQDLRKKLAVTFALPTVIRELPAQAIRRHSDHILDALCQILNTSSELSVPSAQREYQATLELLFDKIGLFSPELTKSQDPEDRRLFESVTHKVFQNLYSLKSSAREIAAKLIERVAARAQISVAALAGLVPHSPGSSTGAQPQGAISWRRHICQEVERMASLILPCLRGGYSRVQPLIAHADALRFALKHEITPTSLEASVHTLLGVAELLLKILEVEAERFDARAEPDPQTRRQHGVESPSSCAQKYMKLERLYISQNQDYDPYSHTQHPHELLTTQHFEVSYQAKRERERRQDEALQLCSFRQLEIFADGSFDRLNQAAARPLPEAEREGLRGSVRDRYQGFIAKLFGAPGGGARSGDNGSRPSDIGYEYVSHLYVLYPNVRQRTELICKCLEVLCDIVTHRSLAHYLRERQQAYFGPQQSSDGRGQGSAARRPEQSERAGASVLESKLDFYAVEIKAKIIAIYFKYFQREEDNILGTARACLERLLNEAPHQQEALPNQILKECVRPALNVLSQPAPSPRAFKHLAMLIEVLHICFNDQLAHHLIGACSQRQAAVRAPYTAPDAAGLGRQASSAARPGQAAQPQPGDAAGGSNLNAAAGRASGPGAAGGANLPAPGATDPDAAAEHARRVVHQYNMDKVGSLETAKHIIQILHLLPNSREHMLGSIESIPGWELRASRELETSHVPLPPGWQQSGHELRPLRVKFGVLQSDFRDGLAKFFNRNPVDCVTLLGRPGMTALTLAIMKMPGSFTVRERIARDIDQTIRPRLRAPPRGSGRPGEERQLITPATLLGVRLVWTLTKFNPSFLCQPQHADVLESLRWSWVKLSELSVDNVPLPPADHPEAMHDLKSQYRKILKCLLAYCRSDRSDKQVLFDLLKGFSYQPIIDLAPLLKFFTEEVPATFPRRRQAGIIEAALQKVETSRGSHEQRYAMFEFAFMPLALACADSQERFDELFPRSTIELFLRTFFGLTSTHGGGGVRVPKWKFIQTNLEHSSQVCYESFHVELIKALCVVLSRVQDVDRLLACLHPREQHSRSHLQENIVDQENDQCRQIIAFLREFAKSGVESATREWSCYALTLLCLKIVDLASGLADVAPEVIMQLSGRPRINELLAEAEQCAAWVFPLVLQQSHALTEQGLVGRTVSNLIKFFEIINTAFAKLRIERRGHEPGMTGLVRSSFAAALDFEGRERQRPELCSLVIQNADVLYPYHLDLRRRLYELIRTGSSRDKPQTPASADRIIKAAATVVNWCQRSAGDGQIRDQSESQQYCERICGHLMDLVHISVSQHAKNDHTNSLPPAELEQLLTDVLKVMKTIFQVHPVGALAPPGEARRTFAESRDVPLTLRLYELNVSLLMVRFGSVDQDQVMLNYVLSSLRLQHEQQHARSGDAKCLLLALKLLETLIPKMLARPKVAEEQVRSAESRLPKCLRELVDQDLHACSHDLEAESLPSHERPESQRPGGSDPQRPQLGRWDQPALQAARDVSRAIPHFSVRLATCLDELAASQMAGSPIRRLRELLLGFSFCKRLVATLAKVVGKERRAIVTERPTFIRNEVAGQDQQANVRDHDLKMEDDIISWAHFEPELDRFNKESVMAGLKWLARRTHALPDDEAAHVFENLQWLPAALAQFKACDFVIEEVDELIGILIQVEPGQERRLQAEKQQALVLRLVERLSESQERKPDRRRDTPAKTKLHNRLFESCIAFLERQSSMSTDYASKLMEQLLICSKGRSVVLKQRLFTVFEKFNGQSLFKKLKFFFTAHQAEHPGRVVNLFVISQLLDFTLMNFRSDSLLEKLPHSAKLHRLSCPHILIERLNLSENATPSSHESRIRSSLTEFAKKQRKFKQLRLSDLLDPLSEVISINPTYHDDKPLADILFTELFWQLWAILSRQEQQYLAECINKMFLSAIKHSQTLQQLLKPATTFARTMLESVAALSPQIRLAPELLQFMAKELNLWHVAIPTLENHIVLCPKNERYVMALGEVYTRLHEEDYLAGLRRSVTESEETRTIVTLGQHGKWEEINQLFAQYITFYAEQEGLYAHLDRHQSVPGKYSRQLPRQFLLSRYEQQGPPQGGSGPAGPAQDQAQDPQQHRQQDPGERYSEHFERPVQQLVSPTQFPRAGPNTKVSELDLRTWETLFIESLKILNKWEQFRDIAHLHGNYDQGGLGDQSPGTHEMWIEFFWQKKDWRNLANFRSTLMNSSSIKYQLYYIFLIIQEQQNQRFDEVFKKVIQLAHQEWESQLPNYVDRAQFESLIMFQQVVESSEGGRSMIREARNLVGNERLKELKAAMNIWRERVPHQCESIRTWKEVLENRNFIYEQLCSFIQPTLNNQADQQPNARAAAGPTGAAGGVQGAGGGHHLGPAPGGQPASQHVELLDICWNLVKLASVSRKQGLPSLALHYQDAAEKKLGPAASGQHDLLKYERFKLQYEGLKLEIGHNTEDPEGVAQRVQDIERRFTADSGYEPWQRASIKRVIADYHLSHGRLTAARQHLIESVSELSKRDPKIWLSYARLNETVYERRQDMQSLLNALKGLLFATTLSLHKSRLIIPRILRLLRSRDHQASDQILAYVRANTEQMPTWIWIFWAPQLLVMLQQDHATMEHQMGRHLLFKLVKVYPQAAYYPLRAKFTFQRHDPTEVLRELLKQLKIRNPHVLHDIEMIGKELGDNVKPRPEEGLCAWLQGLEIGSFFNRPDVESSFRSFLRRLYQNYFQDSARAASPLLRALAPGFRADFLDDNTREPCILKALLRLKNLRDFLLSTINSREQTSHLEELSAFLAHFNRRAIEIPGQHVVSEDEPLPQRTVYLDRFDSLVHRSGLSQRKVVFKASNSKNYPFSASPATDYARFCSEERATQLKVLLNMIFQRHKETLRRGVKFYVPSKLIMYLSKLSQDDLTFADFQETHDFLLQEKGVDPDIALLLQIRWVRQLLDRRPEGQEQSLSSIRSPEVRQLNEDYFEAMVGSTAGDLCEDACFVQPSLLSSYFHRIFYNVDDLFLFKKRFTTYHAANSFFSYTFNQTEFQTLTAMSFCKSTGRLSFSDPRLKSCHKLPQIFDSRTMEEIEAADFEGETRCMPFRLTSNFVDFIGQLGLHGLFAGVMTSCSLAISHHAEKLRCFLVLALKDELLAQPPEEVAAQPNQANQRYELERIAVLNADYTMFKITSLSNHRKVIDLPRTPEELILEGDLDENNPQQWEWVGQTRVPKYMLELTVQKPDMPEEFNKKVFKLIDLALDDSRKRQMPAVWCPWF